jgi:hypothetical protein
VGLDTEGVSILRDHHAAWGLLRYEHAPLALGLLHRVFVAQNIRSVVQADLVEALDNDLYAVRAVRGEQAAPRPALDYLVECSST